MAKVKSGASLDVDAILAGATVEKKSSASSKVPVIAVPNDIKKLVSKKQEIVAKIDALSAEDEIVSSDIINAITPVYENNCKKDFTSSVKVPALNDSTITVSWKSAYSKIATAQEQNIRNVVGENYDRWFTKQTEISVKDKSPEFIKKLIALVGPEKFAEFFAVEQAIVPTANFTEEKYRVLSPEQRNNLNTVVKQYKPSIRTK